MIEEEVIGWVLTAMNQYYGRSLKAFVASPVFYWLTGYEVNDNDPSLSDEDIQQLVEIVSSSGERAREVTKTAAKSYGSKILTAQQQQMQSLGAAQELMFTPISSQLDLAVGMVFHFYGSTLLTFFFFHQYVFS